MTHILGVSIASQANDHSQSNVISQAAPPPIVEPVEHRPRTDVRITPAECEPDEVLKNLPSILEEKPGSASSRQVVVDGLTQHGTVSGQA